MIKKIKIFFSNLSSSPKNNSLSLILIMLLIGFFSGFILFKLTDNIFLLFFMILILLSLALIVGKYQSGNLPNEILSKKSSYLEFYASFLSLSELETSYSLGFLKAVDSLSTSDLKESLETYIENGNFNTPLPLILTNQRLENNLIDYISRLIRLDNEFSSDEISQARSLFEEYQKTFPSNNHANFDIFFYLIPIVLTYALTIIISYLLV
ncbi:MAG: hypothetical protein WCR67_05225 [Bacilli bacterium]